MTTCMFIPLTKVDATQRLVYGTLVAEEVDRTGEIFDYASSKEHVEAWSNTFAKATDGKSVGNLRAMHSKVAAGVFKQVVCNDDTKSVEVCAKVVDDNEWAKTLEGVYTGFSIGGDYVKKWKDGEHTRYTAKPNEGSLADFPAGPSATFSMIKSDGSSELRKFVQPKASVPVNPVQKWVASDGSLHDLKDGARAHNEQLAKTAAAPTDAASTLGAALKDLGAAVATATSSTTLAKRDFSDKERKKLADKGHALPDGSYPIENKTDLENAIKAFGRAKNKSAVKSHIRKRASDLGATDLLPDAWKGDGAEKVAWGDLRKGLYGVSSLAQLIQDLEHCQQSQEFEEAMEGDGSDLSKRLKAACADLVSILRAMVEEETNELFTNDEAIEHGEAMEMAWRSEGVNALAKVLGDKAPAWLAKYGARHGGEDKAHLDSAHDHLQKMGVGCGYEKAGARHSAKDMEHLTKAHDHLAHAGAECATVSSNTGEIPEDTVGEKVYAPDELTKALAAERTKVESLEKVATEAAELVRQTAELVKRQQADIEMLKAQPMPRPGDLQTRLVSKEQDSGGSPTGTFDEFAEKLKTMSPDEAWKAMLRVTPTVPLDGRFGRGQ